MSIVADLLMRHEGLRLKPYRDTLGILTIGYGRNLDQVGISKDEALAMLQNDIEAITEEVRQIVPGFSTLSEVRQAVMVDMGFMGPQRLKGFKLMLDAIEAMDWPRAAQEMLSSEWAKQVCGRAIELAHAMINDRFD